MDTAIGNRDAIDSAKASIRMVIATSMAGGRMSGDDALAVIMCVATTMVAQCDDDAKRLAYVEAVTRAFGAMVEMARIDVNGNFLTGETMATRAIQ